MTTTAATTEILKANTRKTSSLLKKFLKQKYNVNAKVKSEKFAGGTSININYTCGPESKEIELELSGMVYGSFNGMEDIYEYDSDRGTFVFEGYELETFKYMHVTQELPETMKMEMIILVDENMNMENVPSVKTHGMHDRFEEPFGDAFTWSQLFYQNVKTLMFVTDDFENIKITGFESSTGASFDFVFTYMYNGIEYKTNDLKPIDMITKNTEVVYSVGQRVNVTFAKEDGYEGTIKKVSTKSLQVVTDGGDNKLVILSAATIKVLAQPETKASEAKKEDVATINPPAKKEATEQPKNNTEKMLPYMAFVISLSGIVTFPEKELDKAKIITLTPKGLVALSKLKKEHKDGKYNNDVEALVAELGRIGKDMAKVEKEAEKPAPKTEAKEAKKEIVAEKEESKDEPKIHVLLETISKVKNDKDFASVEVLVLTEGLTLISKKKGFEVKLTEFKNGNIYVEDIASKKVYYAMPSRFAIHFDVK